MEEMQLCPRYDTTSEDFEGVSTVASAPSRTTVTNHISPAVELQTPVRVLAPPGLLRCLILSWCDQRAQRLRKAAEREAWEVDVCDGVQTFLQYVFRQKVPLTLVDLPAIEWDGYSEFQSVTAKSRELSESLLIICGAKEDPVEESWARQLGVWTYVSDAAQPVELDWLFVEARKALARQAAVQVDSPAIHITTEAHLHLDR